MAWQCYLRAPGSSGTSEHGLEADSSGRRHVRSNHCNPYASSPGYWGRLLRTLRNRSAQLSIDNPNRAVPDQKNLAGKTQRSAEFTTSNSCVLSDILHASSRRFIRRPVSWRTFLLAHAPRFCGPSRGLLAPPLCGVEPLHLHTRPIEKTIIQRPSMPHCDQPGETRIEYL